MTPDEGGPNSGDEWSRYQELRDREDREYWEERTTTGWGNPPKALSDPEAWALLPPSKQADWCGKTPIRAISHAEGRGFTFPARPCDSWTHEDCATKKADRVVAHLKRVWADPQSLYMASFRTSRIAFSRIRQRRKGQSLPWLWVIRSDGWTHYFSAAPYPGRLEPVEWVQLKPSTAIEVAAAAVLALPGVEKMRAHPRWQPPEPDVGQRKTKTYTVFGPIGEGRWEEAQRQAVEVVRLKYGVSFKPWEGEPLPPEVPVSVWIEELETTVINLRAISRLPPGGGLTVPPTEPKQGESVRLWHP